MVLKYFRYRKEKIENPSLDSGKWELQELEEHAVERAWYN